MVQVKYFAFFVSIFLQVSNLRSSGDESEEFESEDLQSQQFQCDLILLPEQERSLYHSDHPEDAKASRELYNWPKSKKGHVTVPYLISQSSQFCKCVSSEFQVSLNRVSSQLKISWK